MHHYLSFPCSDYTSRCKLCIVYVIMKLHDYVKTAADSDTSGPLSIYHGHHQH